MAPIRGWGIKGERLKGFAPDGRWRTLIFLAAQSRCAHRALRRGWPDQRGHVPAAGASPWRHRHPRQPRGPCARAIRDTVLAAGARLAFLPPYSPDLNPIEQVFAKVKHWLRMAQARSVDAIHDQVAKLVGAIRLAECFSYFTNAGYTSSQT